MHVKEDIEGLNGIYKTIAQLTSIDDCLIIYQNFKGLSVTFPTKLMDVNYVRSYLRKELTNKKALTKEEVQQLAVSFDYSERQIRRFMREEKQKIQADQVKEDELPYVAQWLKNQNGTEMKE